LTGETQERVGCLSLTSHDPANEPQSSVGFCGSHHRNVRLFWHVVDRRDSTTKITAPSCTPNTTTTRSPSGSAYPQYCMQPFPRPASNQDFFNNAWKWLIVDGNPKCSNEQGMCVYRKKETNEHGEPIELSCIIGAFMTEEIVEKLPILTASVATLTEKDSRRYCPEVDELFADVDLRLLSDVQRVHDKGSSLIHRRVRMTCIALNYGLQIPH